jgi:hypothetical protein
MQFQLDHALEVLSRTPHVLRAMLAGLSDAWVQGRYGPDTFNPFDVVGHLIIGEQTDWMVRVVVILEHGEGRPFAPFDRYAMYAASRGKSLEALLDEFTALRARNLVALQALKLTPADLGRRGTHPALGTVSLEQLLATWVAHDLNHIHQIAKAMAYQYVEAVGPWREYMGIYRGM